MVPAHTYLSPQTPAVPHSRQLPPSRAHTLCALYVCSAGDAFDGNPRPPTLCHVESRNW